MSMASSGTVGDVSAGQTVREEKGRLREIRGGEKEMREKNVRICVINNRKQET